MSEVSVEVLIGNAVLVGEFNENFVVEVVAQEPDTSAYIEPVDFTRQGVLTVQAGVTERPISGGTFTIVSVAARVATAPTGSSVVIDIKKNGASIFGAPGDRPTILAGTKNAVVGSWGNVILLSGDYLTVDIVQVGSTQPGANLVVPLRLCKIA